MSGGVGVFSGEEEGFGYGLGHLERGVEASGGDIAVGSEGVAIVRPVVRVDAEEKALEVRGFDAEDLCQRGAGLLCEIVGAEAG